MGEDRLVEVNVLVALTHAAHALRSGAQYRSYADQTSLASSRIDLAALVGTKQVTDFHLLNLAASSNAVLATFDRRLVDALAPAARRHVELVPV